MSKIVERTLDFIELFAQQRRPLTLSEISRLLSLPPSSCHDVLQSLQARGYLYQLHDRGGYYPTLRLLDLATVLAEHDPVARRADLVMRRIREALDESVLLSKVNGLAATYLVVLESSHPLRFHARAGDPVRSLHATSAGKALLGSLEPAAFERYLAGARLAPMTTRTIRSKLALRRAIAQGNRRGWFLNDGETLQGVTTVTVRFTWNRSTYLLTVAAPSARLRPRLRPARALLLAAARELEKPSSA
jgi:DNA-binding IclR family transcriptional regulator